jgi:glycine betaine/proline transport system permease protein
MVLDRVSLGFARRRLPRAKEPSPWRRHRLMGITAIGCVVIVVLAQFIPALHSFPEAWILQRPAVWLSEGADWLVTTFSSVIDAIKTKLLFYVLLPLNRGMISVATPKIWGIELTPVVVATYVLLLAVVAGALARRFGWPAGAAIVTLGVVYYFGITNLPWVVVFLVVIGLAHQVAGRRLASFAGAALAFMLVCGVWREVMMSIYLCGVAVFLSCVIGIPLGIWAALNDRVSATVRPIIDTLQTMPQLVFLLPVVMLFKVGELPALMAMVSYAVVPAIRYTEHGIRNVRADAVEAARAFGCTRRQILLRVQLPQAVPEIMLGMNQTIMFGLSMLVISALVGTRDLGQTIYSALTNGNMGKGLIAGGSMALIAMVADRITQAWAARRKEALGLA